MFGCQEKDPLLYNPSSLVDPRNPDTQNTARKKRRIFGKLVTTSGGRPDAPTKELKEDLGDSENLEYISIGKLNKFFIWRQEFKLKVYS